MAGALAANIGAFGPIGGTFNYIGNKLQQLTGTGKYSPNAAVFVQRTLGDPYGTVTNRAGAAQAMANINQQAAAQNQQAPAQGGGGTGGGVSAPNYYGAALAALNRTANMLNEQEQGYMNRLGTEYGSQRRGLESARATGMENLAQQKGQISREKTKSIRDLSQNIRNAYTSGMNRLGIMGAGDSSAAEMLKYGLGQQRADSQSDIVENYNYNLGNIDTKVKQLERDFSDKISALDVWKESQAFDIRNKFLEARNQLDMKRAELGDGYVNSAQNQLLQQTLGNLSNLSVQVGNAQSIIQNDFAKAAAELKAINPDVANPNMVQAPTNTGTPATAMAALYKKPEDNQPVTQ